MKALLVSALSLVVGASSAWAENKANIPRAELVEALKHANPDDLHHLDQAAISIVNVRVIRCVGPDEEPTEFECIWLMRTSHGWRAYKNWLAIDDRGWRVID